MKRSCARPASRVYRCSEVVEGTRRSRTPPVLPHPRELHHLPGIGAQQSTPHIDSSEDSGGPHRKWPKDEELATESVGDSQPYRLRNSFDSGPQVGGSDSAQVGGSVKCNLHL